MARYNEPDAPINDSRRGDRHENYVLSENLVADDRESIWTIPAKYKGWYFGLFSIQVIVATVWLVKTAIIDGSQNSVSEVLFFIWQSVAPIAITSATFALVIVDTWKTVMVFGTWLEETLEKRRQRQIKAAVEAAVEKTRAEEREAARRALQDWQDWNRRREAAADAGEEFTEPPPGTTQLESKSGSA